MKTIVAFGTGLCLAGLYCHGAENRTARWELGVPIVTYWAGPAMSDAVARQMAEGGWNLVWCGEKDLDIALKAGMRAQLQDPLLSPTSLNDPVLRQKLDELIERVQRHPALFSYFITDEPSAAAFEALGKLVEYLRSRDPAHLAYINLFPTYATNDQLGNRGDTAAAYKDHLRQYVEKVKPALISYDHYQFSTSGDTGQYFLNLSLIRNAALETGVPFLNIVQACTWTPSMRVPKPEEMRYLLYTTVAYGAQGISYYVYCHPGHTGGIANPDGTPTVLYPALAQLNREFAAIARELQPLRSLGVYHAGMLPPGTQALPENAAFAPEFPILPATYKAPQPVTGFLFGYFGPNLTPTHCVIVNLDYSAEADLDIRGPGKLAIFDAALGRWLRARNQREQLHLEPGGGRLVSVRPE